MLKYKAANYLLQEVQLLNQEVDNAASYSCSVPFLVKLKLAVMNYRPRLPYSVHAHISFLYNGALASNSRSMKSAKTAPNANPELAPECQIDGVSPRVIPLLVADDMQTALAARAAQSASQLAFGLSAMIHGAGISANLDSLKQSLTAITNHDLSSTLTVGREAENSLYALITPNNQSSGSASLVSQTYDVAVVLLVPRYYFSGAFDPQSPIISVTQYSEYRDADSGAVLVSAPLKDRAAAAERTIPRHLTPDGLAVWRTLTEEQKVYEAERLARAVATGNPKVFLDTVACIGYGTAGGKRTRLCKGAGDSYFDDWFPQGMLPEAASILDYDNSKMALFQLQLPAPIRIPSQQVILADDGNNPIQVVLGNVSARSVAKVGAILEVTPFDVKAWKSQPPVSIPAQAMNLDPVAHTITASFPSLKKLNITCLSPDPIPPKPMTPRPAAKPAEPAPDPDCPARPAGAGTAERPNGLTLRIVGCDPQRQLCPPLTDTFIADTTKGGWLQRRIDSFSDSQRWIKFDLAAATEDQPADPKLVKLNTSLTEIIGKLREADAALQLRAQAQEQLGHAANATEKLRYSVALADAERNWDGKWRTAKDAAAAAHMAEELENHAVLGVSLLPSAQSTNPAKVVLTNTGPSIAYDASRTGQLIATFAVKPATDVIAISISGASLKAVLDSSGNAIPFTAKHGFVLPQAGVYALQLTGMDKAQTIKVTAQALKSDAPDGDALTTSYQAIPAASQAPDKPAKG